MRRTPLRSRAAELEAERRAEPGYWEWKRPVYGQCAVCRERGPLVRHHIVTEQRVRAAGGDPWALANSLLLGAWCRCHSRHHLAVARISLQVIPPEAIRFAEDLLGKEAAEVYFATYYAPRAGVGLTS